MAAMEVEMKRELRPCIVNGKGKALFHMWEECSEIVPPSPLAGGHTGGVLKFVMGMVELEDGQIIKVNPTSVRFLDNKFIEYAFADSGSSAEG